MLGTVIDNKKKLLYATSRKSYFNGRVKSVKRAFSGFKAEVGKSCFFLVFFICIFNSGHGI